MSASRVSIPARWRRRRVVYPAVYAVAVLLMLFAGCADRFILFPSTDDLRAGDLERRIVARPGGGSVETWVARSRGVRGAEPKAFVLAFNGNADRAERAARAAAEDWAGHPVEVWAVNYPGYGGSPGPARLKSIPPSALAAYDALAAHARGRPVFVTGQSLGTTAALHVAANRPVAGCVLWSPPPLRNMILLRHGWWNLWLLATPVAIAVPSELDSLRNGPNVTAPAVFLTTGRDSVVPLQYQMKVADAYAGEKRYIRLPDSEHNALLEGASVAEYDDALNWLWNSAGLPN